MFNKNFLCLTLLVCLIGVQIAAGRKPSRCPYGFLYDKRTRTCVEQICKPGYTYSEFLDSCYSESGDITTKVCCNGSLVG
uniref:Uncharacterized protein n=1 Tax=Magallana gigas TaxID=29159 RepID=K1PQW6_MAGGI